MIGFFLAVALGAVANARARGVGKASTRSTASTGAALYESERAVREYARFHHAKLTTNEDVEREFPYKEYIATGIDVREALAFAKAIARDAVDATRAGATRALDVGCATGGVTAALARFGPYDEIIGVDFSSAFIDAAKAAQRGEIDGADVEALRRCSFERGDACSLRRDIGHFDVVVASNLLCRLAHPRQFLRACERLVKPNGGALVLASPYSWLEEFTPKSNWLSFQDIRDILREFDFVLESERDRAFLLREHDRKFALGVAHVAVFRRGSMGR